MRYLHQLRHVDKLVIKVISPRILCINRMVLCVQVVYNSLLGIHLCIFPCIRVYRAGIQKKRILTSYNVLRMYVAFFVCVTLIAHLS